MTTLRWDFDIPAPIDEVWAVVSDTDAFNRRAGLGFRFQRVGAEVRGEVRVAGFRTTWRERPFEVQAPRRFVSHRTYDGGPVRSAVTTCTLTGHAGGTRMAYAVELSPAAGVMGLVVPALAQLQIGPPLERALRATIDAIVSRALLDPPPPLSPEAEARLAQGLSGISPAAAAALRAWVERSPRAAQEQIRPLEIAARNGLSADEVVAACLQAADRGVLEQRFALLCPRCREAQDSAAELSLEPRAAHCASCGIRWSGAIVDQVEVLFRPTAAVRPDPVVVDCAASPARSPHVVARVELRPGAEVDLEVGLREGAYRFESGSGVCLVEVVPGAPRSAVLQVGPSALRPRQLTLGPGVVSLHVRSTSERAQSLTGSERWRPPFSLSASAFLAMPSVRSHPRAVPLAAGLHTTFERGWVVSVVGEPSVLDPLQAQLADLPRVWRRAPDTILVVVPDPGLALDVIEDAVRWVRPVSVGVAEGVITVLSQGDARSAVGGPAVDDALDLSLHLGVPRVAVAPDAAASPAFRDALASRAGRVLPKDRGLLIFRSMLDFATPPALLRMPSFPEAEEAPRPWTEPPERIGRYRPIRELGRGGMGVVFECLHADTAERVAVKVLQQPPIPGADRLVQRFFNEAWYASRIRHPNVVGFLDFGLEDEHPWIAMERLEGRTLFAEIRAVGAFPVPRTVAILRAVCDALQALHEQGLVHRDLKPANVFLVDDPAVPAGVKLLDFGLVRRAGAHRTDGVAGTPDYISPEQLVGDPLGPSADVYSVGVLAHRLLTGRLPTSGTSAERFLARMSLDPATLAALDAFGAVGDAVRAALAEDPGARPPSAGALRQRLDRALA